MNDQPAIAPNIRRVVEHALQEIERAFGITVVLATEGGLRGSGCASSDSPHAVQFAYVRKLDWYLALSPGSEEIRLPVSDDFVLSGWDVRKLLRDMKVGYDPALDWLLSDVTYVSEPDAAKKLRDLATLAWDPAVAFKRALDRSERIRGNWQFGSMISYAEFGEAMIETLRARWIAEHANPPPYDGGVLANGLQDELKSEIMGFLETKAQAVGAEDCPLLPRIQVFMDAEMQRLRSLTVQSGQKTEGERYDAAFVDIVRRLG